MEVTPRDHTRIIFGIGAMLGILALNVLCFLVHQTTDGMPQDLAYLYSLRSGVIASSVVALVGITGWGWLASQKK